MRNVLSVQQLTKYYGKLKALNQIDFQIPKGCIFGILGPNGSGKTTFLGIIMNALKADSGNYHWKGPVGADRKLIGTLLETPNFYPYLSARDNLMIGAVRKGCSISDIDRVLKLVHLYDRRRTAFKTFSLGMKQRLAIASALLGNPEVIILDEPTNGLDPVGIADIRNLIIQLGANGKTIIMASHLLDEVEKVCTHVSIFKKGTVLATGTVQQVLNTEETIEISTKDTSRLIAVLPSFSGADHIKQEGSLFRLALKPGYTTGQLNAYCFEQGIVLDHIQKQKKSLELKFLELTNKSN